MISHAADEDDSNIDAVSRALDVLKDAGGRMGEELRNSASAWTKSLLLLDAVGARGPRCDDGRARAGEKEGRG